MCEYCTEHGEGKKWYLLMKHFSEELLHQELALTEYQMVGHTSRAGWIKQINEGLIEKEHNVSKSNNVSTQAASPEDNLSEEDRLKKLKMTHFGQVLPIEDVEKVIDMADSITRIPCGCRLKTTGKADRRYCFGFGIDKLGIMGEYPDSASSLEVLSKEETKKIFHEYDNEGLIHSIWTRIAPYVAGLCNCDRDCVPYRGQIVEGNISRFFRAEYVCQTDWELCTGCKSCMSQCQFGAQFYSSSLAKIYIDPGRCYGCGVCRVACPTDAISLVPRKEIPEVADSWLRNERN